MRKESLTFFTMYKSDYRIMNKLQERIGYMGEFPDFNAAGFNIETYNKKFIESNVIIHAHSKTATFPEHWGSLSIKCAFGGQEFYASSNSLYAVDDDHYLIFNEGKYYSSWIDSEEDVESFTINFTPAFANSFLHSAEASEMNLLDDPFLKKKSSFRFTEKLYQHNLTVTPVLTEMRSLLGDFEFNQDAINECYCTLLEYLYRQQNQTNLEIESVEKLRSVTRTEIYERLTRAKDFIYSGYYNTMSLQDIANAACLNQFYFLRQFKKLFKITPHQFLSQRRMQVAALLLKKDSKSVMEICNDIGYSDIASFSKLFKKTFGSSPSEYRMKSKPSKYFHITG